MKIISGILILVTAFLSFKHGWHGLTIKPGEENFLAEIGIGKTVMMVMSVATLAVGLFVLFPQTFFVGNLLSAIVILFIMAMSLNSGKPRIALSEIPFFLMPLILIWLGHPLKK